MKDASILSAQPHSKETNISFDCENLNLRLIQTLGNTIQASSFWYC